MTAPMRLLVSISNQTLAVLQEDCKICEYSISTALKGAGEQFGSEQTPRGEHVVRAMIGANLPTNTVFIGRRPTGEIYSSELALQYPKRDWILTRILWLSGCDIGVNRLGRVDSMRRYIYIHGTPDSEPMGEPFSHGCIRMRNDDIVDLFDRVSVGTKVLINE